METNIDILMKNEAEVFLKALDVLVQICTNIIQHPENSKFRSISLSKSAFCDKLLPADGALGCLFDMGFEEGSDCFILPETASLDNVKKMHDLLISIKNSKKIATEGTVSSEVMPGSSAGVSSQQQQPINLATYAKPVAQNYSAPPSPLVNLKMTCHNYFLQKILHYSDFVLRYEDKQLQKEALRHVPHFEINSNVEGAIRNLQEAYKKKELAKEHDNYQELLLMALLKWFKNDFFSWMDAPQCRNCGLKPQLTSTQNPIHAYMDRIEVFTCQCGAETLFPRYNDPRILLQTRTGRCGEWANCFTLFCRALGWDARFVLDESDHAWTEVYLSVSQRWAHCDPCEGIMDAPLLYESGWGKKLSYIIAFSCEEAQDVTWRYSGNHQELLKRRNKVAEHDLTDLIIKIRDLRLPLVSAARRKFILLRAVRELAEMLTEKTAVNSNELQGRISGAVEWRRTRGETSTWETNYVWKIQLSDIISDKVIIGYSPATDFYVMGESKKKFLQGWQGGVFEVHAMQRKVEKDWKLAYLCRNENTNNGKIVWRYDLPDDTEIAGVEVIFKTTVFNSGKVEVTLCSGDACVLLPKNKEFLVTEAFNGQRQLEITALLSGGDGDCAFQHSQLFRQPICDTDVHPFIVTFLVKRLSNKC